MRTARTTARRLMLRRLIQNEGIRSQAHAAELLKVVGHEASQATVSRDLAAIGAIRLPKDEVYRVEDNPVRENGNVERLRQVLESYLLDVASSGNLAVIHTPPAGAGPVAAALDGAGIEGLLGTLAGDDTVLAVSADADGGKELEQILLQILEEGA